MNLTPTLPARLSALRPVLGLVLATAVFAPAGAAQDRDTIQFKDGKSDSGLVKSEEYGGVTFNPAKGSARTIPWSEIASNGITYANAIEFQSAKDDLDAKKFDDARAKLEELLGDTKLRSVLKQNAMYYVASILQRQGDWDGAIKAYQGLVAEFPKSRWLMDVGENLVACYSAKKDVGAAGKALDELAAAATAAGVETAFNSSVNVLKARLYEEQGKFAEAQAAYGVAEKATGVPPAVVQRARLGQARCLVALNKRSEAEALFRKLVAESAPNPVLAGAWNGLGDLMVEDARKGGANAEKLLDAVFCYLRGVVQYAPLPGESAAEYRRSLKGAADAFRFISQVEKNTERKRLYEQRAQERMDQLKKEFPGEG